MIKRRIAILFLLLLSLGFSAQYKTIKGKNVLVVEDIIDSGFTLKKVLKLFGSREPKKVSLCTLLNKPERREVEVDVQYIGFEIPNEFVVGYGLDYNENYRNLEYIGIANPEVFE